MSLPAGWWTPAQTVAPLRVARLGTFVVPQLGGCNIPATAAAYSLNVTVVPPSGGTLGYLTIWPTAETQPVVSTLNSPDGRVKANAAIVPAGVSGAVSVYVSNTTNVILDIDAYFAPAGPSTYQFYPLTPCRIVDTRERRWRDAARGSGTRLYDSGKLQCSQQRDGLFVQRHSPPGRRRARLSDRVAQG